MIEIKEVPPVPGEPTYTISGLSQRDLEAIRHLFYFKRGANTEYSDISRAASLRSFPPKLCISGEW